MIPNARPARGWTVPCTPACRALADATVTVRRVMILVALLRCNIAVYPLLALVAFRPL